MNNILKRIVGETFSNNQIMVLEEGGNYFFENVARREPGKFFMKLFYINIVTP